MTQYRESPKLLGLIRTQLGEIAEVAAAAKVLPSFFDIETAYGDTLTIIGKWLGWPRTHCEGQLVPVFGYSRGGRQEGCGSAVPTLGYCEGAYYACPEGSKYRPYTFGDDDVYRRYLKARRIKLRRDFRREAFIEATQELFGDDALIIRESPGVVMASPGRSFSPEELSVLHLAEHVLPVAPGIRLEWAESGPAPFGYGEGWGGYCDSSFYRIITRPEQTELHDEFGYGPKYRGYGYSNWLPTHS
nr:DUF2612 domain-containing protein [Afifella sp. H1R]